MFRRDQIGKVNQNPVGDHAPECLLITGPHSAQFVRDIYGFNRLQHFDGRFYRVERTADGTPLYASTLVTQEEYAGVQLEECRRPSPPTYRLALHDNRLALHSEPLDTTQNEGQS